METNSTNLIYFYAKHFFHILHVWEIEGKLIFIFFFFCGMEDLYQKSISHHVLLFQYLVSHAVRSACTTFISIV